MLHLLYNPPREQQFILACSGGVDSMAAADFFKRGNKKFIVAYFHHKTPQADRMQSFVQEWCRKNFAPFSIGELQGSKPKDQSPEEHWRNERYKWLLSFNQPVITCHHLNDVVETWIFSSLHGNPKLIAPINGLVHRPFILNSKQHMIDWCMSHNVEWFEDESNKDTNFPRNRIRHNILPEALKVNPGLLKVIKKKIIISMQSVK